MYTLGCGLVFFDAPGPVVVTSTILQTPWRAVGEPLLDCANSGTLTNATTIRTNKRFITLPPLSCSKSGSGFAPPQMDSMLCGCGQNRLALDLLIFSAESPRAGRARFPQ